MRCHGVPAEGLSGSLRRVSLFRVALGLLGAAILAGTAWASDPAPVTLLYNAHIFTADYAHPYADALAIRGDTILAVGELSAVEKAAGAANKIDMHGKFLMPGMIDAHAHPIAGGTTLVQATYPDTNDSIPALTAFVKEQMDKKASLLGDVLVIDDLDIGFWAHAADIDAALSTGVFAKQPIVLFGSDGHTAWANRLARTRVGITAAYIKKLSPADRQYYGFDSAFNPNGFLVDAGKNVLDQKLPKPSPEYMLAAGRAAVHYMNSMGITGWLDAAVAGVVGGATPLSVKDPGFLPVYEALGKSGELTAHVVAYPVVRPNDGFQQIDVVEALRARYQGIPNFSMPGLKVFADGVAEIPSQTAALTKPYINTGKSPPSLFTPDRMNALVIEADRRGLRVHVHAIGDLAVKQSLDAFAAARAANPSGTLPFVMTHAQFVDAVDIPRFAQLNVIAALQLLWAVADPSTNEQIKPFIDPVIYQQLYPARSMLDAGTTIAGASDWPVSTANPFLAIYQAETRSGPQGVIQPAQRMPRAAMLYAYTRNSAEAIGMADKVGTLAPGKLADLVAVDRDVLAISAEDLKGATVLWTMLGGKTVYGTGP
jgi:predicted amidohydrolase YtcJ